MFHTSLLLPCSLVSAGAIGCAGGFLAVRGCQRHQGGGGGKKHDLYDIREKVHKLLSPPRSSLHAWLLTYVHMQLTSAPTLMPLCSGVDPTTVAVLMEDGGALMGLAIAGRFNGIVAPPWLSINPLDTVIYIVYNI